MFSTFPFSDLRATPGVTTTLQVKLEHWEALQACKAVSDSVYRDFRLSRSVEFLERERERVLNESFKPYSASFGHLFPNMLTSYRTCCTSAGKFDPSERAETLIRTMCRTNKLYNCVQILDSANPMNIMSYFNDHATVAACGPCIQVLMVMVPSSYIVEMASSDGLQPRSCEAKAKHHWLSIRVAKKFPCFKRNPVMSVMLHQ